MSQRLHEEMIFSGVNVGIFAVVLGWLLFALVYQLAVGPLGPKPASNAFLVIVFLFFLAIAVNASRLRIAIDSQGVHAAYGLIKHTIAWDNIEGSYVDKAPALAYGGWGIRLGIVAGKWRLVYSVVGGPRVVVALKKGWYREFVFSTRKPQEVIKVIDEQLARR